MRSTPLIPMLLICLACTGGTDVDIDVALDPRLAGSVEVISTRSDSPGATNPIDVEIVLANHGGVARQLEFQGRWQDAGGGFQGGTSDVRTLQPGQRETFTAGTRSPRAKSFRLAVNVTTSTQDELLTATLADRTPKAPGHGITYDERPSVDAIPSWTPRGVANEAAFAAKTYFQIKTSLEAKETTSWNTALAWAIEISDWRRVPWVDGGATYQPGGTASGRLYVSFKGSEGGIDDSWLSGSFEDVPIVYYGPPRGD